MYCCRWTLVGAGDCRPPKPWPPTPVIRRIIVYQFHSGNECRWACESFDWCQGVAVQNPHRPGHFQQCMLYIMPGKIPVYGDRRSAYALENRMMFAHDARARVHAPHSVIPPHTLSTVLYSHHPGCLLTSVGGLKTTIILQMHASLPWNPPSAIINAGCSAGSTRIPLWRCAVIITGRALPFSNVHPAYVTQLVSGKIG